MVVVSNVIHFNSGLGAGRCDRCGSHDSTFAVGNRIVFAACSHLGLLLAARQSRD